MKAKRLIALLSFLFIFETALHTGALYAIDAGTDAPDFTLQSQSLSDFKGKVVYLDFWASWCTACKRSFPWMNATQNKYSQDDFQIIAINLDEERETSKEFLKKYGGELLILFDPETETPELYNVLQMPSSYLIDRTGKIVSVHKGFNEKIQSKVDKEITELLGEKK